MIGALTRSTHSYSYVVAELNIFCLLADPMAVLKNTAHFASYMLHIQVNLEKYKNRRIL
jgi:hypothetical protein